MDPPVDVGIGMVLMEAARWHGERNEGEGERKEWNVGVLHANPDEGNSFWGGPYCIQSSEDD